MSKPSLRELGARIVAAPEKYKEAYRIAGCMPQEPATRSRFGKPELVPIKLDIAPSVRIRAEMAKGSQAPPSWMRSAGNDNAAVLFRRAA